MQSWGKLPESHINVWKNKQCDAVFTAQRLHRRALPSCLNTADNSTSPQSELIKLPLIAVMAGSTTRKVTPPVKLSKLALFSYLLPSLMRTLDCGFRYEYVLGYDVNDPFYDTKDVRIKMIYLFLTSLTIFYFIGYERGRNVV